MEKIIKYIKFLNEQPTKKLSCPFCGAEVNLYAGNEAICPFCNALLNIASEPADNADAFYHIVADRMSALRSKAYDKIPEYNESIINTSKSIEAYYGSAVFYKWLSDYYYMLTDYNQYGYMEENAANKAKARDFFAKSKEYFYDVIDACAAEDAIGNPLYLYIKFASELALKKFSDAGQTIALMGKNKMSEFAVDYANLAFYTEIGNIRNANAYLKKLTNKDTCIAYYAARLSLAAGRYAEAKKVLSQIASTTEMPAASKLIAKIDELDV